MNRIRTSAGDRWRRSLHRPDGELAPRVKSLSAEQAFWKGRAQITRRDAYADRVYAALKSQIGDRAIRSVLEIGPGWGNYTLPLARDFPKLTLVDVSPDNLETLKARTADLPCVVKTVCSPWETAEVETHNLIFGYNCLYRLEEPEQFLLHMQQSADRLCVIGMNCPPELPWLPALEQAGLTIHYTRQGCEDLLPVARELGLPAELISVPNHRTYHYENTQALLHRARGFLLEECSDLELLSIVLPFHKQEADGSLRCEYSFRSQFLLWEP